MKIRNAVLFDVNFIESLMHFTKLQLPIKVSYPLQKCLKLFQTEEVAVKASRDELIKKYGAPQMNEKEEAIGWDISKASKEDQEKFINEFNDLMGFEIELPIENKLVLKLANVENLNVSVEHLNSIGSLIDFQD